MTYWVLKHNNQVVKKKGSGEVFMFDSRKLAIKFAKVNGVPKEFTPAKVILLDKGEMQ